MAANARGMIQKFQKELDFEVDKLANRAVRRKMVATVKAAYNHIMSAWPKYTYYSGANNRISITGRPISRIEPRKRPTRKGALSDKFATVMSSELAKLKDLRIEKGKNRRVFIGNAVSYAPDVGYDPGRGREIYATAHSIALARARQKD